MSLIRSWVQRLREIGEARRTLPPKRLGGVLLTYFCFIESSPTFMQHMQPLEAGSVEIARTEAVGLLRQHRRAYAAHIFLDGGHIATIRASDT